MNRQALIREEVQNFIRLGTSKLSQEALVELVCQPKAPREERITGDPSYRILWQRDLLKDFNYTLPGIVGERDTDGIIAQYKKPEFLMCARDVIYSAVNLAYFDPEKAMEIEFTTEYFILNSKKADERFEKKQQRETAMIYADNRVIEVDDILFSQAIN